MNIIIASDHAGYNLKENIKKNISKFNLNIKDVGCYSNDSVDYPVYAHKLIKEFTLNKYNFGILICGTGNGIAMTANKYKDIRAAVCWNNEIAKLVKKHNNANILCLPARFISLEMANKIINNFINSDFEGGRHLKRIKKINK
ncbi:MAG: ribose 5-phosphate isomerase B [Flavobacteriales bacterium TMED288]|nr:ribose 5-phosphate isomerase B [Flavobacteriales bacterium]RPG53053.1 MAG: ribose 5-phosphate isomerase B [Flavobacteriales bacterium TMED288]|tara:strand:+ start:403 stop:831 length:429 start_codon:yes stop_codon:yes gene_type:complete